MTKFMKRASYSTLAIIAIFLLVEGVLMWRQFNKIEDYLFKETINSIVVIDRYMTDYIFDPQYYFYAESIDSQSMDRPNILTRVNDQSNFEFALSFFEEDENLSISHSSSEGNIHLYMADIKIDRTPCSLPCSLYWLEDVENGKYFVRVMSF